MSKLQNVSAMGLIYDNLDSQGNHLQAEGKDFETTKGLTALYALLYDDIAISDSWLLTNAPFQRMLSTRDGIELITQGIITPLRRDTAQSYADFFAQCQAKKMHGLSATPEYVAALDAEPVRNRTRTFELKQVVANYTAMSQQVLSPSVLLSFGISEQANEIIQKRIQQAKDSDEQWHTNTFVKDVLCPLISEHEAALLMELARAPYSLNLPSVLGIGVIGRDDFRGDQILAALSSNPKNVGSIDIKKSVAEAAYNNSIDNPLIKWLLSDEILQDLTAEELVICRSPEERNTYLDKLQRFLALSSKEAWDELVTELTVYLRKAAEDLFRYRAQKNKHITEPTEGVIVVEGSTSIRLQRPGKPVDLTGVSLPSKAPNDLIVTVQEAALSVIGKTVTLPDFNINALGSTLPSGQSGQGLGSGGTKTRSFRKPSRVYSQLAM